MRLNWSQSSSFNTCLMIYGERMFWEISVKFGREYFKIGYLKAESIVLTMIYHLQKTINHEETRKKATERGALFLLLLLRGGIERGAGGNGGRRWWCSSSSGRTSIPPYASPKFAFTERGALLLLL
ncbi:unnamed protein product [Linum tenue]|nr:unnamed protein product [Linum tenue]